MPLAKPSWKGLWELRVPPSPLMTRVLGASTLLVLALLWWLATRGASAEERWISPVVLPSPLEVITSFPVLWYDRGFAASVVDTLLRVYTRVWSVPPLRRTPQDFSVSQ